MRRVAAALIRASSFSVPKELRHDWRAEWLGELHVRSGAPVLV